MSDLRGTILVVEDDQDVRETILDSLRDEGFTAIPAADGKIALRMLRDSPSPPALILLDLMMPGMSGAEFRVAQLGDPRLAEVPVAVISAVSNLDERVAGIQPTAFLRKPLKLQALLDLAERFTKPTGR